MNVRTTGSSDAPAWIQALLREVGEELIAFDREAMAYTYVADGLPVFVGDARNAWQVETRNQDGLIVVANGWAETDPG